VTAPLRVGIDTRRFRPQGGQDRYLWRLGAWLAERKHGVEVLSVRRQPPEVEPPPGVRLHRLHGFSRSALRRYVAGLELDVLLLNPERARRYRGVLANVLRPGYGTEHYRQNLRSFRTPWERGTRTLLRMAPWVLAERRWERQFYEAPDPAPQIIANSWYMRGEILDSYAVGEDHVHVVHNGVDLVEFSPEQRSRLRTGQREEWKIPDDAVCVLFMGHNFRLKGLWQILNVLARLRAEGGARDVRLLVAGKGVGRGQSRKALRLIRRYRLEDAVHLLGPVRPPMRAFAAADVFLHLSWHDSFGFVILEALAAGLPVITTRFAGASELLEHGVSGMLVDPGAPEEILSCVRGLMEDPVRDRMGTAAAEVAAKHPEEENLRTVLDVLRAARTRARGPVR